MVDFPGFEAHPVDLPDAAEMPLHADAGERLRGAEIRFRDEVRGPGVADQRMSDIGVDGRVLVWGSLRPTWRTPRRLDRGPLWPKRSRGVPRGRNTSATSLGIRFDKRTRDLYIVDAYFGLSKVRPEGRLAICVLYISIASLVSAPSLRDYGIIGAGRPLVGYFTSYIYHPLN
ncbi:hypothetical protein ZWY2020_053011 [Hordeum vulgare]|nr:hypothetical protein ZWY2020_053011 [Hordeum vulgare]